jgi:hypothetical protein
MIHHRPTGRAPLDEFIGRMPSNEFDSWHMKPAEAGWPIPQRASARFVSQPDDSSSGSSHHHSSSLIASSR